MYAHVACAYQRVRNISFSENFVRKENEMEFLTPLYAHVPEKLLWVRNVSF